MRRKVNPDPTADWMKREEAYVLAESIKDYWAARGYDFQPTLVGRERKVNEYTKTDYDIRSNIGADGFPPRIALALAA